MKVLLITDDFYPHLGGIAHTLANLCLFFRKTSHDLIILNPYYSSENISALLENKIKTKDIKKFFLKSSFFKSALLTFWAMLKDTRTPFSQRIKMISHLILRPDKLILVIKNVMKICPLFKPSDFDLIMSSSTFWPLFLVHVLSRIFNKKTVTLAHGNDFLIKGPFDFKSSFIKHTDKVIMSNILMKRYIKNMHHLDETQMAVVYRGIDVHSLKVDKSKEWLRKKYDIAENDFIILSVGRHIERKRFNLVIQAIGKLKKKGKGQRIKYYLIGEGRTTDSLKKLTKNLQLEDDVFFLGPCRNEKRNEFYKLSNLFIMPSIKKKGTIEGFGIVFLEANYYKIPVIGTATGGIKEAIINGKTGLLAKPDSIKDLAKKILKIYKNKEFAEKLGENGHKRVTKEYSWSKIINDYVRIFKELLN
ncbi:MAG: glycosyltransferase family 4 protein [archaeon]